MFTSFTGKTINQLALSVYEALLNGRAQPSRNGPIKCVNNAVLSITDARSRHLSLDGRKSNPFAQIAETFWVMSGDDKINPLLSFFLPRAKDFSDDGETWRGAYGPRLYMHDQLNDAINAFVNDGIHTRQSVIQILLPELDSNTALKRHYGLEKTKDRPCNNELVFFATPNEDGDGYKMNCNVFQRSGDAIWGALNINYFEWSFLLELMATNVANKTGEKVEVGEYTHFITNLHLYDFTEVQAKDAVENKQPAYHSVNRTKLTATGDANYDRAFFRDICNVLEEGICADEESEPLNFYLKGIHSINSVFDSYGVPVTNNLLFEYAIAVVAYISCKKYGNDFVLILGDDDFGNMIKNSPFCKFDVDLIDVVKPLD